jgi:hypothetical protein
MQAYDLVKLRSTAPLPGGDPSIRTFCGALLPRTDGAINPAQLQVIENWM